MGAKESRRLRRDLESLKRNDPTLKFLDCENIDIGSDGISALARALRNNTNLRKLKLGHCNIRQDGLNYLVKSLCEDRLVTSRLRKLELSTSSTHIPQGNPIGDEGARSLSLLLTPSMSLHHLRVSACSIGDDGAVSIARALVQNTSLRTLDLSHNSISDIGAEELGLALKSNSALKGLLLWNNRIFHTGAEEIANGLASNFTLQWLGLGCNHIGDEGIKAISLALLSNAQASSLIWLALGGNGITDKGAEHIAIALKTQQGPRTLASRITEDDAETSSLTEQIRHGKLRPMLDLGVTPSQVSLQGERVNRDEVDGDIEKEGDVEEARSYCIPLQSLGLGGNKITCLGAGYLADGLKTNSNLLSLGLADNRIGDEGASSLAELIRQTDTLQKITLSGNNVQDEGGSMLMAALSQNTSLQGLYLAGNPCGDAVSERCREVVGRHNHTLLALDLHDTRMTTPAISELLNTMRAEKVLRSLGSQPLPLSGTKGHASIPPTGNMLEVEEWQPQSYHTVMLQKKVKQFTSIAPSQRHTTLDALGSLPEPEETAQTMVVRQSQQESRRHRRRSSISQYIKRKFSKSKDTSIASYDISSSDVTPVSSNQRQRISRTSQVAIELRPLVEEDDMTDGLIDDREITRSGSDELDGVQETFRSPTVIVEDTKDRKDEVSGELETVIGDTLITTLVKTTNKTPVYTSPPSSVIASSATQQNTNTAASALTSISNVTRNASPTISASTAATSITVPVSNVNTSIPAIETASAPVTNTAPAPATTATSILTTSAPTVKSIATSSISNSSTTIIVSSVSTAISSSKTTMVPSRKTGNAPSPVPIVLTSSAATTISSSSVTDRNAVTSSLISDDSAALDPIEEDIDLDVIPRTISLDSMTRNRPKPPSHRRPPSRFRTPSPSPTHIVRTESPVGQAMDSHSGVRRIGGITNTVKEDGEHGVNVDDTQPIKNQWATALQKRIGVLKMGGFLHRGFDAIMSSDIGKNHNFVAARLPCNHHKNCPVAPLPPSHTRVKLQLVPEELGSDYINANYVGPSTSPKQFIVSQAPIPSTYGDFWRMIWEQRVGVVVVLTEQGEVDLWWPEESEQLSYSLVVEGEWMDNSLLVSSVGEQVNSANPDLMVNSLLLESLADNETDTVKIFHYTNWAQYETVENIRDISGLVRHVLRAKLSQKYCNSPVAVVSKLGAGRAGCFCALSLAYELMTSSEESQIPEKWKEESNILDQIIKGLRECRGGLVSSQKQFEFCHRGLEEVMWGRPASQEELDTWEALTRHKGKKGKKKWKIFGKKEKAKGSKERKKQKVKDSTTNNDIIDTNDTDLLF